MTPHLDLLLALLCLEHYIVLYRCLMLPDVAWPDWSYKMKQFWKFGCVLVAKSCHIQRLTALEVSIL